MNILILEYKKFIRSKIFIVILSIIFILLATLFYKNYLNYQQVDIDKKHELLMIKEEISSILYPADKKSSCIYSKDKEKMNLLKNSLEISEKTLKLKHSGDEKSFMESAILMYEKIIQMHKNNIKFSISKSYAQYEKERLSEIIKSNANFQYENAPLDGVLIEYNNIKYILSTIFLLTIFYFFITTYLDFYHHKGFLFTLPINKNKFINTKVFISLLINLLLIFIQLILILLYSYIIKWKTTFNYPVYFNFYDIFLPAYKIILFYISMEFIFVFLIFLIFLLALKFYKKLKSN